MIIIIINAKTCYPPWRERERRSFADRERERRSFAEVLLSYIYDRERERGEVLLKSCCAVLLSTPALIFPSCPGKLV
jgi:hypothetical protein